LERTLNGDETTTVRFGTSSKLVVCPRVEKVWIALKRIAHVRSDRDSDESRILAPNWVDAEKDSFGTNS
jgi:hypothetical protein